jgi:hypothetical protein
MAKPEVSDVREFLNRYGHEEPAKKFLEELKKARQKIEQKRVSKAKQ